MSQSSTQKWLIFLSTSLLLVLMNFDMTAVNLALVPIAADLHLNIINVQWIITAYLIGGAAMVMLGGLLGDIYGHKKIFLLGTTLFTLASIGVGLASSEWFMIIMRLFQGFGAALAWPLAIVIVRKTFASKEGFAMGLISAVMGISMSIGPPLGGIILYYLNWRWIFLINIPLGILVFITAFIFLQQDNKRTAKNQETIHYPSAILLVLGLLFFIFSLNEVQRFGVTAPLILATFFGGILLLSIFIILQRRISNPLIDLNIFSNLSLSSCFVVRFLWQAMLIGIFLIITLLFQNIFGFSALQTSFFFLIITAASAIASPFSGKLTEIFAARKLITTGLVFYFIAFAWLAMTTRTTPIWEFTIIFFFLGIGTGIAFPALLNSTLALAPVNRRGMVSGILYAMLFSGGSIGAMLSAAIINISAPTFLWHKLHSLGLHFQQSVNTLLVATATGVREVTKLTTGVTASRAKVLTVITQQSFFHALFIAMLVSIIMCIIAMIFAWRIKFNSTIKA